MLNYQKLNDIRHDLISCQQVFKAYHDLVEKEWKGQIYISPKKIREILLRCITRIGQVNQMIFETINENNRKE